MSTLYCCSKFATMIKLKPRTKFCPIHVRLPMLNGKKCGIFLRMRSFCLCRDAWSQSSTICSSMLFVVSLDDDFVVAGSFCVRIVVLFVSMSSHSTPESEAESDSERVRFGALMSLMSCSLMSLFVKEFFGTVTGTYSRKRSGLNCSGCDQYLLLRFNS